MCVDPSVARVSCRRHCSCSLRSCEAFLVGRNPSRGHSGRCRASPFLWPQAGRRKTSGRARGPGRRTNPTGPSSPCFTENTVACANHRGQALCGRGRNKKRTHPNKPAAQYYGKRNTQPSKQTTRERSIIRCHVRGVRRQGSTEGTKKVAQGKQSILRCQHAFVDWPNEKHNTRRGL